MCPRTPFCPARSVNVHLDVFRQLFGVIEAPVARPTIADEPGNGFGFVCSEVFRLLQTTDVFVIVLPAIDDAQMLMIVTLSDMHASCYPTTSFDCNLLPCRTKGFFLTHTMYMVVNTFPMVQLTNARREPR